MSRSLMSFMKAEQLRFGATILAVLLIGMTFTVSIEAQSWNGSVSNSWNDSGNWTPGTVPNSASATATVTNGTNNPVLINGAVTIGNLTVGAADSVSIQNTRTLTVAGGAGTGSLNIQGNLALNSAGNFTDLILGGTANSTITLSGGGNLTLSNSFDNRIYSTASNMLLVNNSGNTIQGSGQFGINSAGNGFTLNNAGTINANQSVALQIAPSGLVTNTGTLEATAGGTLNLTGGTFNNNGGLIFSTGTGSIVNLGGATISGGTLTTSSGGVIENNGNATLDGTTNSPTISSGSTLTLLNTSADDVDGHDYQ